jgi:hypothetical protein
MVVLGNTTCPRIVGVEKNRWGLCDRLLPHLAGKSNLFWATRIGELPRLKKCLYTHAPFLL